MIKYFSPIYQGGFVIQNNIIYISRNYKDAGVNWIGQEPYIFEVKGEDYLIRGFDEEGGEVIQISATTKEYVDRGKHFMESLSFQNVYPGDWKLLKISDYLRNAFKKDKIFKFTSEGIINLKYIQRTTKEFKKKQI